MRWRERWVIWLVVGAFCLMWVGLAQATEFSATMVSKMHGQEMTGKIFIKGDKVRTESEAQGQTSIMIVRPDKNVLWILMPQQKVYVETPLSDDPQQKMMTMSPQDNPNMKLVGTETIKGYECDKYETTASHEGQTTKHYAWISKKLGMPIKTTSADGSMSMEYQDIKVGKLDDSLFEPPKGYRKMPMPVPMPPAK